MDILTIGEVLIDLTQTGKDARGIPQFAANPGGAPANLAVAAARLGTQTAFIGKVGADAFGRYLKEVLAENKVDDSIVTIAKNSGIKLFELSGVEPNPRHSKEGYTRVATSLYGMVVPTATSPCI